MISSIEKPKTISLSLVHSEISCPKCNVSMKATTLMGVNVEKCRLCEGMFFDRGEAELLVRRHLRAQRLTKRFWGWIHTSLKTN